LLSLVGLGLPPVRDLLSLVGFALPPVRQLTLIGFRTGQAAELLKGTLCAIPSGQGAPPSSLDTFMNVLSALSSGFSTLRFLRRTADGGLIAKQSRLHPSACLTVGLVEIPRRRARVLHSDIIAPFVAYP
jgi:hypothetical protein